MGEGQEEIYYLTGESPEVVERSPHLEVFKERGQEVLLLSEPVDEFMAQSLGQYKDKPLKAVNRGEIEDEIGKKTKEEADEKYKDLIEALKEALKDEVKEVRFSTRLKESAACLVADENDLSPHMEQIMRTLGRGEDLPDVKPILELNPEHPAVKALEAIHGKDAKDPRVVDYGRILFDEALIAEGLKVSDPAAFARRVNALMTQAGEAT
jgi:molecular chaperone HtpG